MKFGIKTGSCSPTCRHRQHHFSESGKTNWDIMGGRFPPKISTLPCADKVLGWEPLPVGFLLTSRRVPCRNHAVFMELRRLQPFSSASQGTKLDHWFPSDFPMKNCHQNCHQRGILIEANLYFSWRARAGIPVSKVDGLYNCYLCAISQRRISRRLKSQSSGI